MFYLGAYSSFTLKRKILYFDAYTSLFLSVFSPIYENGYQTVTAIIM